MNLKYITVTLTMYYDIMERQWYEDKAQISGARSWGEKSKMKGTEIFYTSIVTTGSHNYHLLSF